MCIRDRPTDDIQKGLRPKRSIRAAMAHDVSQFAVVQVYAFLELALTTGYKSFVVKMFHWITMTGKKSRKELDRQNERRREHRAAAKHFKSNVVRDGAQEEVVHKMVGSIIKRLLYNVRANETRRNSGANRTDATRARAKKQRQLLKLEAEKKEISTVALLKQKAHARAEKPKTYSDRTQYAKDRKLKDPKFKITTNLRTRLGEFLRLKNSTKAHGTMALVGCSKERLMQHLQSRLPEGADIGERDLSIDHIFPMTMYDSTKEEEQKKMMHFSNLQPMTRSQNSAKNNRLPSLQEALQVERWAWPVGITEADLQ